MGNVTPELCDALSRLTCDEWHAVRTVMDRAHSDALAGWLEEAKAHYLNERGPARCELTGPEVMEMVGASTSRR